MTNETPYEEKSFTRSTAVLYLLLTAVLWSTSGVLVKMLDWHPLSIWAGRSTLAFFVFLLTLRRFPRKRPSRTQIAGILCLLSTQMLFITSNKMTTAANAIFLQYTAPVYIVLLAYWFLRERPERADWITMGVIFIGLVFFFGDELNFDSMVGSLLALLSGVTLTGMTVAMRAQKDGSPAETIMLSHLVAAIIGMPSLVRETFTPQSLGIIVFLGIFQIGLAFIFYAAAIKHVPAMESTLILTLEPVLNPVWVFLVLGESPGPRALIGGIIVVGAVTGRALIGAGISRKRDGPVAGNSHP
jgi:drug/metabolite transporter (DMT)-like permease